MSKLPDKEPKDSTDSNSEASRSSPGTLDFKAALLHSGAGAGGSKAQKASTDSDASQSRLDLGSSSGKLTRATKVVNRLGEIDPAAASHSPTTSSSNSSADERTRRLAKFVKRNKCFTNELSIDLRWLNVDETLKTVKRILLHGALGGVAKRLRLITGRGKLSGGISGRRLAVEQLCTAECLAFHDEKDKDGYKNPAVMIVPFDGRTSFIFQDFGDDFEL